MTHRQAIAILPPPVAQRIAAGEVIERPVSVVRELLDNAIDAGASEVTVELAGGGLELIRVSDNGCGIPPAEVELAVRHHATSKITSLDDLLRLNTLGFRGEALPSIAAVSELELSTRGEEYDYGTTIVVHGGEVIRKVRTARQPGTTVSVRHLFRNVPVRRTFLLASRGETILVGRLVRRYALAHPALRLSLLLDGRLSFRSQGSGRLSEVLAQVYGAAIAATLLAVWAELGRERVLIGYLSDRGVTRPGRDQLTLVLNQRLATCRGLLNAIEAAYRPFLPRGRHPIGVITLSLPPAEVDANVHPAKSEVRLAREDSVASAVGEAVRRTFAEAPSRPAPGDDLSLAGGQYRMRLTSRRIAEQRQPEWSDAADEEPLRRMLRLSPIIGQVRETLILVDGSNGLLLVDQHRAHERIMYERLHRRVEQGRGDREEGPRGEAQSLLEPILLEVKLQQADLVAERLAYLEALGLSCQRIGSRDFLVRAVPAIDGEEDLRSHLLPLLEEAGSAEDGWQDRLLASLACRAAVRRKRPLTLDRMEALIRDLAQTVAPAVCPHGSPLVLHVGDRFLERQFRW